MSSLHLDCLEANSCCYSRESPELWLSEWISYSNESLWCSVIRTFHLSEHPLIPTCLDNRLATVFQLIGFMLEL